MCLNGSRLFLLAVWMCCWIMYNVNDVLTAQSRPESFKPEVLQIKSIQPRGIQFSKDSKVTHSISIVGDQFVLDGLPLHILSGSLHYFRLPAAYWRDRLRKLKAAGLNSVSTYVEWSYHEPEERQYLFEGDRDIAQFVQIAAEEGLHVLLRPGPYICAERDLGGLPYWLLGKYHNIQLRTTDKDFIEETRTWMAKLFSHLTPLLFGNGGPIILVQVENEYGSYSNDKVYMSQVRDILREHVATNALLYTTDGMSSSYFRAGSVPDTLTTIDFGVGYNVKEVFMPLRKFMESGPLMNSEYYPGWLTHWGETFQTVKTDLVVATLHDMLINNINLNFYMFFGGTNFEFSAGANYGGTYLPDITSYDYDAPLSEAGDPTPKYYAIRQLLEQFNPELKNLTLPVPSPKGAYGTVTVRPKLHLFSPEGRLNMGKQYTTITDSKLPTFEKLRQRAGLMLYETTLNETNGLLQIRQPRDRIYVYVNGLMQGIISRTYKIYSVPIIATPKDVLSLLVENQGRINFGSHLHDYKGILSSVTFNNSELKGPWSLTGYPLETLNTTIQSSIQTNSINLSNGPVIYEGEFNLPEGQQPMDTFLDTTGWGKGFIWINGYNLGRYWPAVGPQVTLYVPGVWLRQQNTIQVLELEAPHNNLSLQFIDRPILQRSVKK